MRFILSQSLFENKKYIQKILDESDFDESDIKYLKDLTKKNPNNLTKLLKWVLEGEDIGSSISPVYEYYLELREKNLKVPDINQFETPEKLYDYLQDLENSYKVNKIVQELPSNLKSKYRSLKDKSKVDYYFLELYNRKDKKEIIVKLSKYKNVNDLLEIIKKLLSGSNEYYDILKSLEKDENSEVLYSKNNVILAEIKSYTKSCEIGSRSWCISTSEHMWSSYVTENNNKQLFLWNFNLDPSDNLSLIGITIKNIEQILRSFDKKPIETSHNRRDEYIKYSDLSKILNSIDKELHEIVFDTFEISKSYITKGDIRTTYNICSYYMKNGEYDKIDKLRKLDGIDISSKVLIDLLISEPSPYIKNLDPKIILNIYHILYLTLGINEFSRTDLYSRLISLINNDIKDKSLDGKIEYFEDVFIKESGYTIKFMYKKFFNGKLDQVDDLSPRSKFIYTMTFEPPTSFPKLINPILDDVDSEVLVKYLDHIFRSNNADFFTKYIRKCEKDFGKEFIDRCDDKIKIYINSFSYSLNKPTTKILNLINDMMIKYPTSLNETFKSFLYIVSMVNNYTSDYPLDIIITHLNNMMSGKIDFDTRDVLTILYILIIDYNDDQIEENKEMLVHFLNKFSYYKVYDIAMGSNNKDIMDIYKEKFISDSIKYSDHAPTLSEMFFTILKSQNKDNENIKKLIDKLPDNVVSNIYTHKKDGKVNTDIIEYIKNKITK